MATDPSSGELYPRRYFDAPPPKWRSVPIKFQRDALPDIPRLSPDGLARYLSWGRINKEGRESVERAALLGSAEVRACLVSVLLDRYPEMPCYGIKGMTDQLLSRKTLAFLAWSYGLYDVEMLGKPRTNERHAVHSELKYASLLFEAYLGAIARERGRAGVSEWVTALYSTEVLSEQFLANIAEQEERQKRKRSSGEARMSTADANQGEKHKSKRQRKKEKAQAEGGLKVEQ